MPEQDYTDADRFSEMRRLIHPDTAEEPWRWGNVRTVVAMLIDEVQEHGREIYALQVVSNARDEAEGHGMTRQDLIGHRLPVEVTQRSAALGQLVEYSEGSPEHLDELRDALAGARGALGNFFAMKHERDVARGDARKLRNERGAALEAAGLAMGVLREIDDVRAMEALRECRAILGQVEGWDEEDG